MNYIKRKNIICSDLYLFWGLLFICILTSLECIMILKNSLYILIFITFLFLSLVGYIYSKNKVSLIIPIIWMFLINGLREPIFVDDRRYAEIFFSINDSISNVFLLQNEKGYLFLNYIISIFTDNYNITQIILLGLSFCFLYKGISRLQDSVEPFFVLIYYFFVLLNRFSSAGLVRMQIAVSIYIFSISFLKDKNIKKFFVWIIIASLFHRSALAGMILIIPFCFEKFLVKRPYNVIALFALTLSAIISLNPIISFISNILGGKYSSYVNIINFHISALSIFYIGSFVYLFFMKNFLDKNCSYFYDTCIYMFLIAIFIDLFFTGKTAFGRINYYFLLSYAFLMGYIWKNCRVFFCKLGVLFIFGFFIVVYFRGGQLGDSYIVSFFENYKNMLLK